MYSPLFVQPTESLFTEIGSRFIKEVGRTQLHIKDVSITKDFL